MTGRTLPENQHGELSSFAKHNLLNHYLFIYLFIELVDLCNFLQGQEYKIVILPDSVSDVEYDGSAKITM